MTMRDGSLFKDPYKLTKTKGGITLTIDKSSWPDGPWKTEPDRVEWLSHGLPCLISRGPSGALCGYVAVPPGHSMHGKDYNETDLDWCPHGGLTYADKCNEGPVCHVAREGEPDAVWWLGFDCAHHGDLLPQHEALLTKTGFSMTVAGSSGFWGKREYRDLAYVTAEVEQLAALLAGME